MRRRQAARSLWAVAGPLVALAIACTGNTAQEESSGRDSGSGSGAAETYTVETMDGATVVRNSAPLWGGSPHLRLDPVRVLGCGEDDLALYRPADIAIGPVSDLYVLDAGNHRILQIDAQGSLVASFGESGQGPGELQQVTGLVIDDAGRMYVADEAIRGVKVLTPAGEGVRTLSTGTTVGRMVLLSSDNLAIAGPELINGPQTENLIALFSSDGDLVGGFGELLLFEDWDAYRFFNRISIAAGKDDEVFVAYSTRNKIEKYDAAGDLVLRFDRPLEYEISQEVRQVARQVGSRTMELPELNFVSESIAIDAAGRIWVLSYDRQLSFEETGLTITFMSESGSVESRETLKVAERTATDAFSFHLFDPAGRFLGQIPIDHHGGPVEIVDDRLYILEPRHDMCVYEYRIVTAEPVG